MSALLQTVSYQYREIISFLSPSHHQHQAADILMDTGTQIQMLDASIKWNSLRKTFDN